MKIDLIPVPYHLGQESIGMGKGPACYLQAGADRLLSQQGFEIRVEHVERGEPFSDELSAIIDINSQLATCVKSAIEEGCFPIVLGGNCNTCLGTLAGLHSSQVGLVWFDAHGDFNTPATTPSGFFDGMALAVATGHCYQNLRVQIGQSEPVAESRTLHVGGRDFDSEEGANLESSEILVVSPGEIKKTGVRAALIPGLKKLRTEGPDVYVHVDIDVLDPCVAPGVDYRCPNGLALSDVEQALQMIAECCRIRAAALTAYNPELDEDDKTLKSGLQILSRLAEATALYCGD